MTYEEFTQRYTFNTETDLLGEGGFGEVFKAYDNYLDKWVAIKQSKVKKGMENFTLQKEVELATKLPVHPNIAHYEECHRFNIPMMGTFDFGILQYYEEGNLSKLRKTGKINAKNLNDILEGILNGLHHLHSHKIIHRDIKPGNILIANRGTEFIPKITDPKITDFGISKQGANLQASAISNSLAGGTYSYAAPEQLKGESKIHPNADLWSFGVILYELLTNKLPFEATTSDKSSEAARSEVINQIISGRLPDDLDALSGIYYEIVKACLALSPHARIKSAKELLSYFQANKVNAPLFLNPIKPESEAIEITMPDIQESEPMGYENSSPPIHNFPKFLIEKVKGIDIEMIFIEGGSFMMGSEEYDNEKPIHRVDLDGFFIGKFPVSQALWQAVMGNNPSWFQQGRVLKSRLIDKNIVLEDDTSLFPVEQVSWNDAQEFIEELNRLTGKKFRLPTEAEWEYACRAGTTTPFNTDNNLTTAQANYNGNYPYNNNAKGKYRDKTLPVGSFAANAYGLFDMHGNVFEWCSDWYDAYSTSAQTNPKGASSGSRRVIRGGSWDYRAFIYRTAIRLNCTPGYRYSFIGFRLVSPK